LLVAFTRVPKIEAFADVPHYCLGTYMAIASYASNQKGVCYPSLKTLSARLGCSTRTVSRHIRVLIAAGLLKAVRRRYKGRYSSNLYTVIFIATTRHTRRGGSGDPYIRRTRTTKVTTPRPIKEGYEWLFQ
jgi:DNA-binding transcriptional MocR family regulator